MTPGLVEANASPVSSWIGRASMSARSDSTSPARRAAERRDDAGGRRPRELESVERAQRLLDESRGIDLLERELRVRVQMSAPADRVLLELGRDESAHRVHSDAPITCR